MDVSFRRLKNMSSDGTPPGPDRPAEPNPMLFAFDHEGINEERPFTITAATCLTQPERSIGKARWFC